MAVEETKITSPEWVEDDGSGMTCVDCEFMATSKACGGSEKYLCEKFNFLLSSDINKKCKDFEER